ncbi:MAG: hypothetical protein ABIL70_07015 [candidate division WOR-3 bacterium]
MAKVDRVVCPLCVFNAKYIDLILTQEGNYLCPNCTTTFIYEELMQLYGFSQLIGLTKEETQNLHL